MAHDDTYYDGMSSHSVVLQCPEGSQIWLQTGTGTCYVSSGLRQSIFGGFILQLQY